MIAAYRAGISPWLRAPAAVLPSSRLNGSSDPSAMALGVAVAHCAAVAANPFTMPFCDLSGLSGCPAQAGPTLTSRPSHTFRRDIGCLPLHRSAVEGVAL